MFTFDGFSPEQKDAHQYSTLAKGFSIICWGIVSREANDHAKWWTLNASFQLLILRATKKVALSKATLFE